MAGISDPPPVPSTLELVLGVLVLVIVGVYCGATRVRDEMPPRVRRGLQLLLLVAFALLLFVLQMRFGR